MSSVNKVILVGNLGRDPEVRHTQDGKPIKFNVLNRWAQKVQFTAEINCDENAAYSVKLGLAVKWGVETRANLAGAYLGGADLGGAYLAVADLMDAKNAVLAIARTRILPEGTLIGWKKLKDGVIAKLEIPAEARRSHAFGRKCRAEYVKCLEVIGAEFGVSMHDETTQYRAGEIIKPHLFNENWQEECAGGIHFYITREEAEAHS